MVAISMRRQLTPGNFQVSSKNEKSRENFRLFFCIFIHLGGVYGDLALFSASMLGFKIYSPSIFKPKMPFLRLFSAYF
jgi:hypothetical protein